MECFKCGKDVDISNKAVTLFENMSIVKGVDLIANDEEISKIKELGGPEIIDWKEYSDRENKGRKILCGKCYIDRLGRVGRLGN